MTALPAPALAALREAAEWRLIGLLLERPRPRWAQEVAALAGEVADPALAAAAATVAEATEGEYLRWLGPGAAVSPREAGHLGLAQQAGHVLADLASFYEAFAYSGLAEEPADHVATEAGFVGYLKVKEAFALAAGDAQDAEAARRSAAEFVEDHLSALAEPLERALSPSAPPHLRAAAAALRARVGPRRRPSAPAAAADGAGCAFACGSGEED